jgi:hypothetical protein
MFKNLMGITALVASFSHVLADTRAAALYLLPPQEVVAKYQADPYSHYDELIEYARLVEGKDAEIAKEILEHSIKELNDQYERLATINFYFRGIGMLSLIGAVIWNHQHTIQNLSTKEFDLMCQKYVIANKELTAAGNKLPRSNTIITSADRTIAMLRINHVNQAIENLNHASSDVDRSLTETENRLRSNQRKLPYILGVELVLVFVIAELAVFIDYVYHTPLQGMQDAVDILEQKQVPIIMPSVEYI